eukprot:SAG31_NODE_10476_length_1134_cov_1.013527_1_plen_57_part_00
MRCRPREPLVLGLLGLMASGRALGCDYEDPVTEMQTCAPPAPPARPRCPPVLLLLR